METTPSKLKLFISYNSSDEDVNGFICQLKTKLESDGCDKAFIFQSPEDNRPGDNWPDNLAEQIKSCDAFLAVITQGYLNSDICFDEFHAAHVTHKKRIIPIIFEDRKPDYNTGKHGGAIRMGADPINRVSFQKPEMEEIPYKKLLIGLGLKEPIPGMPSFSNDILTIINLLIQRYRRNRYWINTRYNVYIVKLSIANFQYYLSSMLILSL